MSRAYRLKVRETLRRVVRGEDHVRSQLEVLEILPGEQMAELLGAELKRRGFERENGKAVRKQEGVTVIVELATGEVTVQAEASEKVELEGQREGWYYERSQRDKEKERVREQLAKQLEQDAERHQDKLQKQATDQLEAELADLKGELDQAVNRVTAEALKQKARQLGQIKQLTEDAEAGSLTIVVEV